ncbi:tRNA pseudouridine(38-40) synthase TruA [Pararhizobium haloflavum]|uniref:tRNA pseudouridine(38-40) synthase TruA n=1 Tax=Pararhizobium haloflavum TaxID=2037914 RepID=UPI000C18DB32|nr:tRNA pseudouridine(38-40) synthase TruA [Pararhizobium haloflavum]
MPRYRIIVEYDGTGYVGWQRQENGPSIQAALEQAIACFSGEAPRVSGAGRTDAGVHARGQVAHFDLSKQWPFETVRNAINAHLTMARQTVCVLDAAEVAEDFDARFSARKRHYLYRFINRAAPLTLEAARAWRVARSLDAAAMNEAAQLLVGRHDFTTFRSVQCQANSPVRTMDRLDVTRCGERIDLQVTAQSFLHNQIRSFAGSLKLVGEGKWRPDDLRTALEARDRKACGPVAPPCGLYFMQVDY